MDTYLSHPLIRTVQTTRLRSLHPCCLICGDRDTNVLRMRCFAILGVRRYIEFGGTGGCSEQSLPPGNMWISRRISPCVVGINAYANMAEPSSSLWIVRNIRRMRLILLALIAVLLLGQRNWRPHRRRTPAARCGLFDHLNQIFSPEDRTRRG